MGVAVTTPTADPPPGGWTRVGNPWAVARAAVVAPFTRRAGRELVFCLAGLPFAMLNPLVLFVLTVDMIWLVADSGRGNPSPAEIAIAGVCVGLLLVLLVSTEAARRFGALQRMLATRLLGTRVGVPPPVRRSPAGGDWPGPRDAAGWRVVAYLLAKLPVGLIELYAVFFWIGGLANLGYPLWWGAFRNHPPGVRLSPVPVLTPFGLFGEGTFHVATLPGTFAAAAAGAAMLLAAPWVSRAVTSADAWLIRGLLGPGRLAQRVHDLELSRALAVDDSAALLRRLERNLHDGAQIRLATLAMKPRHGPQEARRRRRGSRRRGRPRVGRRRAPRRQGRARRATQPGPRDPPAGARQRAGRRPRLAGRRQRDPGRAAGQPTRPGAAACPGLRSG